MIMDLFPRLKSQSVYPLFSYLSLKLGGAEIYPLS